MPHRPWSDLSNREKEQVTLVVFALDELAAGLHSVQYVAAKLPPRSASDRFLQNGIYEYLNSFYLTGTAQGLQHVLNAIGCEDLIQPIDNLLAEPIGSSTLGKLTRGFRNKFLSHRSFTFGPANEVAFRPLEGPNEEADSERLRELTRHLVEATVSLAGPLCGRYPEAKECYGEYLSGESPEF